MNCFIKSDIINEQNSFYNPKPAERIDDIVPMMKNYLFKNQINAQGIEEEVDIVVNVDNKKLEELQEFILEGVDQIVDMELKVISIASNEYKYGSSNEKSREQ